MQSKKLLLAAGWVVAIGARDGKLFFLFLQGVKVYCIPVHLTHHWAFEVVETLYQIVCNGSI